MDDDKRIMIGADGGGDPNVFGQCLFRVTPMAAVYDAQMQDVPTQRLITRLAHLHDLQIVAHASAAATRRVLDARCANYFVCRECEQKFVDAPCYFLERRELARGPGHAFNNKTSICYQCYTQWHTDQPWHSEHECGYCFVSITSGPLIVAFRMQLALPGPCTGLLVREFIHRVLKVDAAKPLLLKLDDVPLDNSAIIFAAHSAGFMGTLKVTVESK